MKGLKITLWIAAIGCLMAVPLVFLPWAAIETFGSWFGVESIPNAPIAIYFFKVAVALVSLIGVFFVILARDPLKYGPMLNLAAYGLILFGVLALAVGFFNMVAPIVYLGDGLSGLILGIVALFFSSKLNQAQV